jgi:predicted ATP-dependent endonuclease of OLD family
MTDAPQWIKDIEFEAGPKLVLLVEGKTDVLLLRHFLAQYSPEWDKRFHVAFAGNKEQVFIGVKSHRPHWLGVVDQDEWNLQDVQERIKSSPHLKILPRFCIESYFCSPIELWAALPQAQRSHVGDDPQKLAASILTALPDWVAHGAMWRVLRRLRSAAHLPTQFDERPITDETEIRQILQTWHDQLAPDKVIEQYHQELNTAKQLSQDEQLTRYVHGKKFYNQVVVKVLNQLFERGEADDWLQRFRDEKMPPPQDLQELLDWVLSFVS